MTINKRSRCLLIAGVTIVLAVIVGWLYATIYFWHNPLDEPSVRFQQYVPSYLPNGIKIAKTDATAIVLKRDPRQDRQEWLGWDLQRAQLYVVLKDSSGNSTAYVTESAYKSKTHCTRENSTFNLTTSGRPYCLIARTDRNQIGIYFDIATTAIGVYVDASHGTSFSNEDWENFVDSFHKTHMLNVPIEAHSDPMGYPS